MSKVQEDVQLVSILKSAIQYELCRQFPEALEAYEKGIQMLLDHIKNEKDANIKQIIKDKTTHYIEQAECIKKTIISEKQIKSAIHKSIKIQDGSTGFGYVNIFGSFLDSSVLNVIIEDPYVRAFHQCQLLTRFCELLLEKCQKLERICLITTKDSDDRLQREAFEMLTISLQEHNVIFDVRIQPSLHDRQITLNTGWVFKIGRGLDYFKKASSKFHIGTFDLNKRPCLQTTVDIFRKI